MEKTKVNYIIKSAEIKASQKDPSKTYLLITTNTGAKIYSYDKDNQPALNHEGIEITGDGWTDKGFAHIKNILITGVPGQSLPPPQTPQPMAAPQPQPKIPPQPLQSNPSPPARSASTNESIESQVAFKGVVELINTGKLPIDGRAGLLAQAYAISRLQDALPDAMVEFVNKTLVTKGEAKLKAEKKVEK